MKEIHQKLKDSVLDSTQDHLPDQIMKSGIPYVLNMATDQLYYIDPTDACKRLVIPPGPFQKELLQLAHGMIH